MKILFTSDIHQHIPKWADLTEVVCREKPRFVCIAGDLLPKQGGFQAQQDFFKQLDAYFRTMKESCDCTILTYLGNDDFHPLEHELDELQAEGLCVNIDRRVHRIDGMVFCGMNKVRDYPFGYKHWCVPDGKFVKCPQQLCGEGLTVDAHGRWLNIVNLEQHLTGKPSIADELMRLKNQLTDDEMRRSIWLVHQPPAFLGMDICAHCERVGSPTVLEFIEDNQPMIGCSGHIHESPYQSGGNWRANIGDSLWLQPGQIGSKLHYVMAEVDSLNHKVNSVKHSILE